MVNEFPGDQPASPRASLSRQAIGVIVVGVLLLACLWPMLSRLAEFYWKSKDYSHALLVPLVSAAAAYGIWRTRAARRWQGASWLGVAVAAGGLTTALLGYWYRCAGMTLGLGAEFLWAIGLVVFLVGACLSIGGWGLVAAFAFPLGYLLCAVPLPIAVTNFVTLPLREFISIAATRAVRLFGVPVFREGNVLHLASTSLGVEDACSGIRSLWTMVSAAWAMAYWLGAGFAGGTALCIAAAPVAVGVNLLRVVLTALLVAWIGPAWATGVRHEVCGLIVFALGALAILWLAWPLSHRRKEGLPEIAPEPERPAAPRDLAARRLGIEAMLAVLLLACTACRVVVERHYAMRILAKSDRKSLADFPSQIGRYTLDEKSSLTQLENKVLKPFDSLVRTYQRNANELVELKILYWEPFRVRQPALVGPHMIDGCYTAYGWSLVERFELDPRLVRLPIPLASVHVSAFRKAGRAVLILSWRQRDAVGGGFSWPRSMSAKLSALVDSWRTPVVKRDVQYLVTIRVEADPSLEVGKELAIEFARVLAPLLPAYGIGKRPSAPHPAS